MIEDFSKRISNARTALLNGNSEYGFRSFVDCVLDTKDLANYRRCIALVEQKEQFSPDEYQQEILQFLDEMAGSSKVYSPKTLVKAVGLTRSYGDGKFQLDHVSLEIQAGEIIGLVGENGNGKTTLLRILAKELDVDKGSIDYGLNKMNDYDMRTQLIYIPQRTPVWHGSLYDNLKFTAANYGVKGEENQLLVDMMIIRFGLWDYRLLNWSELSSGYKMRFELARTFLRQPKILLLDEPLGNLDVKSQQIILEDLRGLAKSPTNPIGIVLSSQQLFEVEKSADKVLFLQKGEMKYVVDKSAKEETISTVIELETSATIEEIQAVFGGLPEIKVTFNGGIYTLEFTEQNGFKKTLQLIANSDLEVVYLRNISHSTRRFFI